jgi:hypothetical protein|tara:strand:- start:3127 stop:3882 length:756 start_codon:yes stop_codon:yes gene_type:complete
MRWVNWDYLIMKNLFNKYILNFGCDWSNKSDVINKVREYGPNLQHADYGLRDDFDVVEAAITQSPHALEFASRHLRNDKKIALIAIKNGSNEYISEELKNNKEFAIEVWQTTNHLTQKIFYQPPNILPPLYGESSVWLELANHFGEGITFQHFMNMSEKVISNKEFMMKLVKREPLCFQHASEKLRDDEELAELAVQGWANQLAYASDRIKNLEKFQNIYLGSQIPDLGEEEAHRQLNRVLAGQDPYRNTY